MLMQSRRIRRRGAAAVEFALVSIFLFMILLGILDLCRFLMVRHVVHAAVREGARFALAHVNDPDVSNQTVDRVRQSLLGVDLGAAGTAAVIDVYASDAAGNSVGDPGTAGFGQYLCVRIQTGFRFIFPDILRVGGTLPLEAKCLVQSEGQ